MIRRFRPALLVLAVLASGCMAVTVPQTAEEFRQVVRGDRSRVLGHAHFVKIERETYEVARPLRDVARSIKTKAEKCLAGRTRMSDTTINIGIGTMPLGGTLTTYRVYFKPTVRVGRERVELHLQQRVKGRHLSGEPPDGSYILVVDLYPVNTRTTRVEIFRPTTEIRPMVSTIKDWVGGSVAGCPIRAA